MINRWAQRWTDLIDDGTPQVVRRLLQGRNMLRSGRVIGVAVNRGAATGTVQGFSATPLSVEITLPVFDDAVWARIVDALASQVRHRARLLAGQVPDGLDSQLEARGLSLVPARSEIDITCRCDDKVTPCMHAAGVWLALAEEIDRDPFALLRLRGRGRERLLAEVAAARTAATPAAPVGRAVNELSLDTWIVAAGDVDDFVPAPPPPPRTSAGPLRLLGDPPGWAGGVSPGDLFAPLIERGAQWAGALLDDPSAPAPAAD